MKNYVAVTVCIGKREAASKGARDQPALVGCTGQHRRRTSADGRRCAYSLQGNNNTQIGTGKYTYIAHSTIKNRL